MIVRIIVEICGHDGNKSKSIKKGRGRFKKVQLPTEIFFYRCSIVQALVLKTSLSGYLLPAASGFCFFF